MNTIITHTIPTLGATFSQIKQALCKIISVQIPLPFEQIKHHSRFWCFKKETSISWSQPISCCFLNCLWIESQHTLFISRMITIWGKSWICLTMLGQFLPVLGICYPLSSYKIEQRWDIWISGTSKWFYRCTCSICRLFIWQ